MPMSQIEWFRVTKYPPPKTPVLGGGLLHKRVKISGMSSDEENINKKDARTIFITFMVLEISIVFQPI